MKNPYEHLKIDCLDDVLPVEIQQSCVVAGGTTETITIYTSQLSDGSWVYGYMVYWASGRVSSRKPTAMLGRFRSAKDAQLYAIGFMQSYATYFQASTRGELSSAEAELLQQQLF